MHAPLSTGNRHYNQMRRIHPEDSVAKLNFYLSSTPQAQSSAASSLSSTSTTSSRTDGFQSKTDSSGDDSYYNTALNRTLHKQNRQNCTIVPVQESNHWNSNQLKKLHKDKRAICEEPEEDKKKFTSPIDTSGFSEGTIVEGTCRESFGKVGGHQAQLGNLNWRSQGADRAARGREYVKRQSDIVEHINPARRASSALSNKQNLVRFKNRNNRCNGRRLLDGRDHLINPYALSELFSQSEIPGFREIFASDSYLRKFCWIVAFLFMTVLSLNDMTELITEYYEYPITVDVRLRDSSRLPFPSVTVCNLNVVRFSALCSSTPSSRYELASQIPSELRDKLCGIQVDKKNTTGDSDIGDINNIGITTTTTTTTSSTTTVAPTSTTTAAATTTTTTPSARPTSGDTLATDEDGLKPDENVEGTTLAGATSVRSVVGQQSEHRQYETTGFPSAATSQAPNVFVRPTTRPNGALDLGPPDLFADPSLLVYGRRRIAKSSSPAANRKQRSIRFTETEIAMDESQPRPFASAKRRIRVRQPTMTTTQTGGGIAQQTSISRLNAHNIGGAQSVGSIGGNQAVRTGQTNPIPTMANGHPNPLLNNLGAPPPPPQSTSTTTTPVPATTTFVPPTLPEDFELTERQERELQENLTNWLAVMYNRDPRLTWSLGHQFDDMILRCTMKSVNCTHQRSFENSFTPTEGNCFTYRSKIRRRLVPGGGQSSAGHATYDEANLAGTNHGLELVLNLEKNEYVSGSSQVGALVMIHHPNDLGYAASEATFVAPEFTTYIGLKMVNITRLPAPYPEYCIDSWPAKFADTLTRNSTYSQQACLKICLQKTIQSHCQCQSAFLPIVELESSSTSNSQPPINAAAGNNGTADNKKASSEQRIIICDTRKLATRQCVRDVMFRAADRVHNCECPPKCQVVRYDKTISMARWPTREDKVTFDRGKMDVNFQNLAKVIVYFQTMTCEEVTQQAVFNAAKLFSALGGIMGMYVGFSFLSVFEIFEVMSRKMWHHFTAKLASKTSGIIGKFRA